MVAAARVEPRAACGRLNEGPVHLGESDVAIAHRWPTESAGSVGTLPDRRFDIDTPAPRVTGPRVLIADDQPDVLEALRLLLKGEGYKIESVGSPAAILEAIAAEEFAAVLMDLNSAP